MEDYCFRQIDNQWYFIPARLLYQFKEFEANKIFLDINVLSKQEIADLQITDFSEYMIKSPEHYLIHRFEYIGED